MKRLQGPHHGRHSEGWAGGRREEKGRLRAGRALGPAVGAGGAG